MKKIKKLTKEQAIIISGYTGILCCKFEDLHKDVEKRLGRPLFTHEFSTNKEEVKLVYHDDFMELIPK